MFRTIFFLAALSLLQGCSAPDQQISTPTDIGPTLREPGRPTHWHSSSSILRGTKCEAYVGFCSYVDSPTALPQFYRITVEYRSKNASWVVYQREIKPLDLRKDLATKKAPDIVRYNPESGEVTFSINDPGLTYTIPNELRGD